MKDVPTSEWPAEWAAFVGMGGCGAVATVKGMGLTCTTDLGASATVQGLAPGISGMLCDKCAASCKADGQDCPAPVAVSTAAAEVACPSRDFESHKQECIEAVASDLPCQGLCKQLYGKDAFGETCQPAWGLFQGGAALSGKLQKKCDQALESDIAQEQRFDSEMCKDGDVSCLSALHADSLTSRAEIKLEGEDHWRSSIVGSVVFDGEGKSQFCTLNDMNMQFNGITFINYRNAPYPYLDPKQGSGGVFYMIYGALTLQDCSFSDNIANLGGAVTNNDGALTIRRSLFRRCRAITIADQSGALRGGIGGSIYTAVSRKNDISDSVFEDCSSSWVGGAFYLLSSSVTMHKCIFRRNTCEGYGGGVHLYSARGAQLRDVVFESNDAITQNGGGLYIALTELSSNRKMTGERLVFVTNQAGKFGGGLFMSQLVRPNGDYRKNVVDDAVELTKCEWRGNKAGSAGGAVGAKASDFTIAGAIMEDNSALLGGGMSFDTAAAKIDDLELRRNTAARGGALGALGDSMVQLHRMQCHENVAENGAGGCAFVGGTSVFEAIGSKISHNRASTNGGGIAAEGTSRVLLGGKGSLLERNEALTGGGASLGCDTDVMITGTDISKNSADDAGGLHWLMCGSLKMRVLRACTFEGNRAASNGGGLWISAGVYRLDWPASCVPRTRLACQPCTKEKTGVPAVCQGLDWHASRVPRTRLACQPCTKD